MAMNNTELGMLLPSSRMNDFLDEIIKQSTDTAKTYRLTPEGFAKYIKENASTLGPTVVASISSIGFITNMAFVGFTIGNVIGAVSTALIACAIWYIPLFFHRSSCGCKMKLKRISNSSDESSNRTEETIHLCPKHMAEWINAARMSE